MSEKLNYTDKGQAELEQNSAELSRSEEQQLGQVAIEAVKEKVQVVDSKKLSFSEIEKAFKGQKIFPNNNPDKVNVSKYGKYNPNMTVVIPTTWYQVHEQKRPWHEVAPVKNVNPYAYTKIPEITNDLGIDYNAEVDGAMPVSFWRSKAGKPCCEVLQGEDIKKAKHIMIRTSFRRGVGMGNSWLDSADDSHHYSGLAQARRMFERDEPEEGQPSATERTGITYFHHASSNGGGIGHDFYVVPIDYDKKEWQGEKHQNNPQLAKARKAIFYNKFKAEREQFAEETIAEEESRRMSRQERARLLPEITALQAELKERQEKYNQRASELQISQTDSRGIEIGDNDFTFFGQHEDYSDASLDYIKKELDIYYQGLDEDLKAAEENFADYTASLPLAERIQEVAPSLGFEVVGSVAPWKEGITIKEFLREKFFRWKDLLDALVYMGDEEAIKEANTIPEEFVELVEVMRERANDAKISHFKADSKGIHISCGGLDKDFDFTQTEAITKFIDYFGNNSKEYRKKYGAR